VTDRDAILRAIGQAPDDDAPRLVYADWLDECKEPARAELIRVQCELARLGTGTLRTDAERERQKHCRWREKELLADCDWFTFGTLYIRPVTTTKDETNRSLVDQGEPVGLVARGFLEALYIEALDWLEQGDVLADVQPPIRDVTLTTALSTDLPEGKRWLYATDKVGGPVQWPAVSEFKTGRGFHANLLHVAYDGLRGDP
jgi:uncharacterized protein (TIGR02996 family)